MMSGPNCERTTTRDGEPTDERPDESPAEPGGDSGSDRPDRSRDGPSRTRHVDAVTGARRRRVDATAPDAAASAIPRDVAGADRVEPGGADRTEPAGADRTEPGGAAGRSPTASRPRSAERVVDSVETAGIDRWNVGLVAGLLLGGAGILLGNTAVFLSAVIGVAYAVYGSATRPPALDLVVERELDDVAPLPGHDVTATVTLRNVGERSLPDVRVLDGVPATLGVEAGSPRYCASLRPGETASFSYALATSRGTHEFGPTTVVARNVAGSVGRQATVTLPATVTVDARAGELPPRGQTIPHTGEVMTDEGGEGIEFYATRQYARGDPMKRIDWKRYANTHELRTIDFRVTEAASVVVAVDRRDDNRVARAPDERSALDLSAYAAGHVAASLLAGNNRAGVVAIGDEGGYVRPGVGRDQELRIRRLLEDGPGALEGRPGFLAGVGRTGRGGWSGRRGVIDRVRRHLPNDAQVVFCSPLLDDDPVSSVTRLSAYGHAVTVVSPDVTGATIGGRIEGFARQRRLHDLRERGIRVVDWSPDEPLYLAVEHARRRWSQ